jgi:hypothetical protein
MLKVKVANPKNQIILNGAVIGRVSDTASAEVVIAKGAAIMAQCGKNFPNRPVAKHDGRNWIITDGGCAFCGGEMVADGEWDSCMECGAV